MGLPSFFRSNDNDVDIDVPTQSINGALSGPEKGRLSTLAKDDEPMLALTSSSSSDESNGEDDSISIGIRKDWRLSLIEVGKKYGCNNTTTSSLSSISHEEKQNEEERLPLPANGDEQASETVEDKRQAEETTAIKSSKSGQSTFDKIMCHMISCGIIEVGNEETPSANGGLQGSSTNADDKEEQKSPKCCPQPIDVATSCNPFSALFAATSHNSDGNVEASYDEQTLVTTIQQSFSSDSSRKEEVKIEVLPPPAHSPLKNDTIPIANPSSATDIKHFLKSKGRSVDAVDKDIEEGPRNVALFDDLHVTKTEKLQSKLKSLYSEKKRRAGCLIILFVLLIVIVISLLSTGKSKDSESANVGSKIKAVAFAGGKKDDPSPSPSSSPTTEAPSSVPSSAPTQFDPSQCGVRRRQSWRKMTCREQNEFMNAIHILKEEGTYDEFTRIHYDSADTAHLEDSFLPWHRWFLYSFETALQRAAGYCIALPYWDWDATPEDAMSVIFKSTTFGSEQSGCVRDGLVDGWRSFGNGGGCVHRDFNYNTRYVVSEEEILSRITNIGNYNDFRPALEGSPHASIHHFISGTFSDRYSPNDAVFYLHHVTIDRIWALWQDYHGHDDDSWDPSNFGRLHYSGSDIDNPMIFESVRWSDLSNPMTGRYPTPREVLTNFGSIVNVQYVDDRLALLLQQTDPWNYNNGHRAKDSRWVLPASSRGWSSIQEGCPGEDGNNSGLCTTLGYECMADEDCCSGRCGKDSLCDSICLRTGQNCAADSDCCSGFCDLEHGGFCRKKDEEDDRTAFPDSQKQERWEELMTLNPDNPQFVFERMGSEDCDARITSRTITTWPCHVT